MRKKIISCLLSVTLILNPVLGYANAYADEASTDNAQAVEETANEYGNSDGDPASSGRVLPNSDFGGYSGLPHSIEGADEESSQEIDATPTFLHERETPEIRNPNSRALPAVVAWLSAIGVAANAVTKIQNLISNGSSSEEETLLYGILEALVEDGWTAAEYLEYIESYVQSCMAHLNNIYYQLRYTNSAGNTYSAGRMLYELWDLTEEIPGYLYYTNSKGYTYDVAAMIYDVWETLYRMEAVQVDVYQLLPDLFKHTNSKGYTYDVAYMLYDVWETLYRMEEYFPELSQLSHIRDNLEYTNSKDYTYDVAAMIYALWELLAPSSSESGNILVDIRNALSNISTPEVEIPDIEVEVKTDKEADLTGSFNLWELIFGALEFGLIAASISDLGDTMQTTFPFSLVAGFVAIIGLLQAEPVAPSFDFPMPDGVGGTVEYTVDLAPFDDVAAVFRVLITVVFILGLIGITRNFIFKGGSSE